MLNANTGRQFGAACSFASEMYIPFAKVKQKKVTGLIHLNF